MFHDPRRAMRCAAVSAFASAAGLLAQEVHVNNGEVLEGAVVAVEGCRAKVRTADGAMRAIDARSILFERLADGTEQRHACTVAAGAVPAVAAPSLARLKAGEALSPPEVAALTSHCTAELIAALAELTGHEQAAVRCAAAAALASSATREGMRAALDAAGADARGAIWRAIAGHLTSGAALAALTDAEARPDLERACTAKDKPVRFACAAAAARLGSAAALPVLTAFLGDSDHHVRESAATFLAECGDAAGAKVLLAMCKRERSPLEVANRQADAETRALVARVARRERIRSCELLGRLRHAPAVPTLTALARHRDVGLAQAAAKALEAIGAGAAR